MSVKKPEFFAGLGGRYLTYCPVEMLQPPPLVRGFSVGLAVLSVVHASEAS